MTKLREAHSEVSIPALCALFGFSKQAYYQSFSRKYDHQVCKEIILQAIHDIRQEMPQLGGRKLHYLLRSILPDDIQIGRDQLFTLLRENNCLIRKRIFHPRTTDSVHRMHMYPNLIKEYVPTSVNSLYVSDITYVRREDGGFYYLSLITDAYSRKVVGWCLLDTLDSTGPLIALLQSIKDLPPHSHPIHHSDRGCQYCCGKYVKLLIDNGFDISMTEDGDPRDNAIAERVNGIIKNELLYSYSITSLAEARKIVKGVIDIYNNKRPHSSIGYLTPQEASNKSGPLTKLWKNYYGNKQEKRNTI